MTHQDYVSRSRNPKNKKSPYNQQEATQPVISVKMKLLAVCTLVACAGFGYFLWSIKDIEPEVQTAPTTTPSTTKKTPSIPKPPEEKWRYIEELKSKEVEVGEYKVETKGPWKMQCGSFRTLTQAEKMKATIAFSGLASQISVSNGSNGTWHKVYLGPYDKKRDAEKDKRKLSNNNISTCQIWLWN